MRLLNIILAFYVFALSFLPCTDKDENVSSVGATSYIYDNNSHSTHSHQEESCDLCSPFCVCGCCGSFVFEAKINFYDAQSVLCNCLDKTNFSYINSFTSHFYGNIWQPPKI